MLRYNKASASLLGSTACSTYCTSQSSTRAAKLSSDVADVHTLRLIHSSAGPAEPVECRPDLRHHRAQARQALLQLVADDDPAGEAKGSANGGLIFVAGARSSKSAFARACAALR